MELIMMIPEEPIGREKVQRACLTAELKENTDRSLAPPSLKIKPLAFRPDFIKTIAPANALWQRARQNVSRRVNGGVDALLSRRPSNCLGSPAAPPPEAISVSLEKCWFP